MKAAIAGIPESDWKTFRDGEIAETIHCMNKTDKAFKLIVLRDLGSRIYSKTMGHIAIMPSPAIEPMKTRRRRCNGIASAATPAKIASRI